MAAIVKTMELRKYTIVWTRKNSTERRYWQIWSDCHVNAHEYAARHVEAENGRLLNVLHGWMSTPQN